MIKVSIPYKSHNNKYMWDYMTTICAQLNNINLAKDFSAIEASVDNVIYVIIDSRFSSVSMLVSLSRMLSGEEKYEPYVDTWASFSEPVFSSDFPNSNSIYILSFDIKKYNSVLSFAEDYKDRDKINVYLDTEKEKLYYGVSTNNYVDLSPIPISNDIRNYILKSYEQYLTQKDKQEQTQKLLSVESVDKNSFLMPFMAYKDFLNFATYHKNNKSAIITEDLNYFVNELIDDEGNLVFYCKNILRKDKFFLGNRTNFGVSVGLWQLLAILQHFKFWNHLYYNDNNVAYLVFNDNAPEVSTAVHLFQNVSFENEVLEPDYSNYHLVGHMHSNEMFRLNKLYSNANRTCFFDFSTQTFTGNNYVFNDDKLDVKTVDLSDKIDAQLPLKMTFTEIKHYVGSDLSQKNFMLHVYTDGIRVMLERFSGDDTQMECRVIFNHAMSKKNQNLTI